MRQKLLFFISILALNFWSVSFADEDSPPLPPPLPIVEEDSDPDQISFIDKVKNFFGFAKKEDSAENQEGYQDNSEAEFIDEPDLPTELEEPEVQEEVRTPAEGVSIVQKDFDNETSGASLPPELVGSTEEGPVVNHAIFSSSKAKIEKETDLSLPKGFEEFADDKSKVEGASVPDSSQSEEGDAPSSAVIAVDDDASQSPPVEIVPGSGDNNKVDKDELGLSLPEGFEEFADEKKEKLAVRALPPVDSAEAPQVKKEEGREKTPDVSAVVAPKNSDIGLAVSADDSTSKPSVSTERQIDLASTDKKKPDVTTEGAEIKLAVPNYVSEVGNKSIIDKYKKELDSRKSKPQQIVKISDAELVGDNNKIDKFTEVTAAELDEDVLQFVNNEAQVLLLPDDDVVEGRLTEDAKLNMMDLRSYIRLFWLKYDKAQREVKNYKIEKFIDEYNSQQRVDYSEQDLDSGLRAAFKAVGTNNIDNLIALLNSYPILQLTDEGKNTLLHEAAYVGNYSAAKLLVFKGIDIRARNANNQTAMSIARRHNNKDIVFLLKSAGVK